MNKTIIGKLLIALLIGIFLCCAYVIPWKSTTTMDERTYLEMTLGILRTGLPLVENGPIDQFPMLKTEWNLSRDGRLWGIYAPGYPYVMAPILAMFGTEGMVRANFFFMALMALGVFMLAREALGQADLPAAATAWIATVSAPVWANAFGISSYTLAIATVPWAFWALLRSHNSNVSCARNL